MTSDNELRAAVYLAGEILPQRPIVVRDPLSGIVGRFFFKLEVVDDDQVAARGYAPLTQEDIQPGPDGAENVTVTLQLSPGMFQHMPQTGSPWSKLLVFLGPRLTKPMIDVFPDESSKNSQMWLSGEIHKALEYIGTLQEALTKKEALAKLPKAVQSFGLKAQPIFFSHLRFEEGLQDGRKMQEYKFYGLLADGTLGQLGEKELYAVLAQASGLKQLEVVRPDDEGGRLEFSLITGWNGGTILMLPQVELLPAWATRPLANIDLVFVYDYAEDIKFTPQEKSAFNTTDFAAHKFQPAYVLALKAVGESIDASLVSRQNDSVVPDSVVSLKLHGRFTSSQENFLDGLVWAARWACSKALSLQPEEVVKAGIYLEFAKQWSFVNRETIAKELKAALTADAAPKVLPKQVLLPLVFKEKNEETEELGVAENVVSSEYTTAL